MKHLCDFSPGRSTILKYLSIIFFFINTGLILDVGNCAFAGEATDYSIHLFSFKGLEEAKAKVEEFNELGYNAFYKQETTDGKADVYNVYIERFKSRAEAEKEADILKELGLISDYDIHGIIIKPKSVPKNERQESKPVKQDAKSYHLKVGSLREKANAEAIVKTLRDAGYHAFFNYETVKETGEWYRVYIDEYKSKADAERDAKKLVEAGIISGYEIKRTTENIRTAETKKKDENKIYSLHVASYREISHADDDVLRLSGLGLKAFSRKTEVSGEQWFRVYVGEYSEDKEARETGTELAGKGVITYFKPVLIDKISE
jgi:cell division septation protein DedD